MERNGIVASMPPIVMGQFFVKPIVVGGKLLSLRPFKQELKLEICLMHGGCNKHGFYITTKLRKFSVTAIKGRTE